MNKREVGGYGERLACDYLVSLGFDYIEKNVYLGHGEIDLVMKKEKCYFFVEVKFRRSEKYGKPREAMTPVKIKKIKKAVADYVAKNKLWGRAYKISFLGIMEKNGEIKYDWLESIF